MATIDDVYNLVYSLFNGSAALRINNIIVAPSATYSALQMSGSANHAAVVITGGTDADAVQVVGTGIGHGLFAQGGLTGNAVYALGGGTSGDALHLFAPATGRAIYARSYNDVAIDINVDHGFSGIRVDAGGNGSAAVEITGSSDGPGLRVTGSPTGNGVEFKGGATGGMFSGHGLYLYSHAAGASSLYCESYDGDTVSLFSNGTGPSALRLSASGPAAYFDAHGGDYDAFLLAGSGTGAGLKASGGTSGHGMSLRGFGSGRAALDLDGAYGSCHGLLARGSSGYAAARLTGNASPGLSIDSDGASAAVSIQASGLAGAAVGVSVSSYTALQFTGTKHDAIIIQATGTDSPDPSCDAVSLSGYGNGNGLRLTGSGTGNGLSAQGGITGNAIYALGGATSGDALHLYAPATGNAIYAHTYNDVAIDVAVSHGFSGIRVAAGGNGSAAVEIAGTYDGPGLRVTGSPTGNGAEFIGGATSGDGLYSAIDNSVLGNPVTFNQIMQMMFSMAKGAMIEDPITGNITFYKNDGATQAYAVNVTQTTRTPL